MLLDDTPLFSLFPEYKKDNGHALNFVQWSYENFLELSVSKSKEMNINFRKQIHELNGENTL